MGLISDRMEDGGKMNPAASVLSAVNALAFLPMVARLTSHPVMISDLSGRTVWVNEAFTLLSGWTREEIIGKQPYECLHGRDTSEAAKEIIRSNTAKGQPFQCEILNYRRDGTPFWISLDAQPILDEDGVLQGYLSVQNDISDRKKFEAELVRKHRLLETIGNCLSMFITSEDPRVAFGEMLTHLLELTGSEYGFIGEVLFDESSLPWLKTFALSNISWDADSRALYEQHQASGFEFRNLKTLFGSAMVSGEPVISNSPSTDPRRSGLPAGHPPLNSFLGLPILRGNRMVGLIGLANQPDGYSESDIRFLEPLATAIGQLIDAYRRDVHRREIEHSLRQTEEWLEETGRVAEVGAWQVDLATRQLRWSAQTYRMHEVPPGYVPDVESAINFYDPEARPIMEKAIRRAIEHGTPWDLELPFTTAKGRPRWVQAVGHVAYEDGKVTRLFGTFSDITEKRRIENEQSSLHAQVARSQKMESVGRLAGGIAHDFNNMLAVILGHAEMLALDEQLLPRYRSHLKAIQTAGQRSADLTQQLLAFARRQNAAPQKLDIDKSVKRMLELLRKSLGEHIQIDWMPCEDLWMVNIDPVQLDQILANLCMNARDAILESGRILLSTRNETLTSNRHFRSSEIRAGQYVVLTISDNGCGMSETTLQHLFEPFNTTKPVGQSPGAGLGLATVYGIVQQNGGAIDVESDSAIGTTFRIYFPALAGAEPEHHSPLKSDCRLKGKTVLLVEDEPALLKLGRMSLKQLGYKSFTATNAREALQMVQSHGPSIGVVVTDVVLPGCNGWTLARQIHNMQPEIRFVFMSGYGNSAQTAGPATQHPFPILSKPFDLHGLGSAIQAAAGLD